MPNTEPTRTADKVQIRWVKRQHSIAGMVGVMQFFTIAYAMSGPNGYNLRTALPMEHEALTVRYTSQQDAMRAATVVYRDFWLAIEGGKASE